MNAAGCRVLTVRSSRPSWTSWGCAVPLAAFPAHRRALRRVSVNVEFNGALCRGLLAARFDSAADTDNGPTLLDFVHGRVTGEARAVN